MYREMPCNSGILPSPECFSYSRANLSPRIISLEACELARAFVIGERSWGRTGTGIRQVAMRMAIHFTCASNLSGRSRDAIIFKPLETEVPEAHSKDDSLACTKK